ncbi:hypothetical protein HDF16_000456 [Granulicella aggregans]|uniref:Uncharacterized protein n=1 Tax=Granulicella aggregans TaxID=474949 RepID=A0A7W8E1T9_9BACT|nr:hypothetical protein [Granulicella aggregans]
MMAFISSLSIWLGMKSSIERLTWFSLILYALRHKENVAAKFGHGTFEIVATGKGLRKVP